MEAGAVLLAREFSITLAGQNGPRVAFLTTRVIKSRERDQNDLEKQQSVAIAFAAVPVNITAGFFIRFTLREQHGSERCAWRLFLV